MLVRSVALAILATSASAFAPSLSIRGPPHAAAARSSLAARPASVSVKPQQAARLSAGAGLLGLRAGVETDALQGVEVVSVSTGQVVPAARKTGKVLLAFLTHFGDLSSWEYAQQLRLAVPELQAQGVEVMAVGIGGASAAKLFAKRTGFPEELLYYDETAACASALNYSPGFGRDSPAQPQSNGASPYLRLLPMLLGMGSPGTLGKVVYGYFGDRSVDPAWIPATLKATATGAFPYVAPEMFDRLGAGYLRPFELATVRLQNMIGILNDWDNLIPANQDLVVQQGGTLVLDQGEAIYRFDDKGILVYAPVNEAVTAALGAPSRAISSKN